MSDKPKRPSGSGCMWWTVAVAIVVFIVFWGIPRCSFRVPKGAVAVLMSELYNVGDGIEEEVYREGRHFYNPLVTDYFFVDTTARALTFGAQEGEMRANIARFGATDYWRRQPATGYWELSRDSFPSEESTHEGNVEMRFPRSSIRTKTRDGEDVVLGATVVYRVTDHNAKQLVRIAGPDLSKLEEVALIPGARSVIRTVFGELDSEAFFDAAERKAKALACQVALQGLLSPVGVTVEAFTLDQFTFDDEFHRFLEEKKIVKQRIDSVGQEQEASLEELTEELERAKADVKTQMAQADNNLEGAKRDAEAIVEQMVQEADAVRVQARRQADLERERLEVLAGPGGEAALRLRLIRALKGKPIVILPDAAAAQVGQNLPDLLDMFSQQVKPQKVE